MKKINSINYGEKVIGVGFICMLIIPGILLWVATFFECYYIYVIANILFVTGAGVLMGFAGLLLIEFRQDKRIDKYYCEHKNVKIELASGRYECGLCGSRTIGVDSTYCRICGCKYKD
ncbi:MAG: hypothetical protein IJB96_01535 [Lachnospira sp.]|nr:hypothetical protein [Lachnospira sp.]